jgi:predicted Zn-dependent protease
VETVSDYIVYPFATIGGRNYFIGKGPYGFEVTGAISVLAVIAHETGHLTGKFHGEDMIQREYDSIMEVGK